MDEKTCNGCAHFLQHYGLDGKRLFKVDCGHCTKKVGYRKSPDTKACKMYSPGGDSADPFVTKEYLSKELLNYMLRLELLPEIQQQL